ncbi:twin transmembrane helix small protein [Alcaligenes sp. A-TC2]|uniref:twin transmembrane helix small protein n=1 Tax=Alcaligenes nematophilus TaxID=2994643 RepID=UPI002253CAB6|nr:twin transmembrane helix small protein [Alcaligenes nematophilus]MCX5472180.1 twin transmembrane helix small protein [Alcaligenes nematophilus]
MRVLVLIVFLGIIVSLGSALVYLMRDRGNSNRMAYALTWRVGLSVALFLFVLLAHYLGWIESTGVPLT